MNKLAPLVLALPLVTLAGWTALGEDSPPFSRSRWIAEQEARGTARFEGGVLPMDREDRERLQERLETSLRSLPLQAPARSPAPARFTRISRDLLKPNGGRAQPETQAEPFLAIDPERETHLLAGYQESRFDDGGARALTFAVSRNGGRTWKEGLVPKLTRDSGGPFERASDPWVAIGPGGRAYYAALGFNETSLDNGVFLSVSQNGGSTWGAPVTVHANSNTDFDDKESISVDNQPDSPFRGRVYVGWDTAIGNGSQPARIAYSADGGGSFTPFRTLDNQGFSLGVVSVSGPGGVVHAVWTRFERNSATLMSARSEDGGDNWSAPVAIAQIFAAGVEGLRTGDGLASVAVDRETGTLYVVWQDDRFSPGTDQVVLSRSSDGGGTWSSPLLVSDGPRDAPNFTPAVAVNGNGLVGVSHYSLRNDPARRNFADEYLSISRDQGQSFEPGKRVSSVSWDLGSAAVTEGGLFLGDYQGLVAGRQTFFPVWIATFLSSRANRNRKQPDAVTWPIIVR
jgi:hypothetical protein